MASMGSGGRIWGTFIHPKNDGRWEQVNSLLWPPLGPNNTPFYDTNLHPTHAMTSWHHGIMTSILPRFSTLWNVIIVPGNMVMNKYNAPFRLLSLIGQVCNGNSMLFTHVPLIISSALQGCPELLAFAVQYIIVRAPRAMSSNLTTNGLPMPSSSQSTYDLVPADQLGFTEAQLPDQPLRGAQADGNATATGPGADMNKLNGAVVNGENATSGERWRDTLQMANRYYASYDIRVRIFS